MPRPKRAKVAPSAPTAIPFLPRTKGKPLESTPSFASSDGNSDGIAVVVKATHPRRSKLGKDGQRALMSGALGGDVTRDQQLPQHETDWKRNGTVGMGQLGSDDPCNTSDKENERPASRTVAISKFSKPRTTLQSTPLTLSNQCRTADGQHSKQANHVRRQPHATPLGDSSILSLADFKRRPRQPSILGIGRPDDTATLSSLGPLSGDGEDDLDDFQPEDESTPLHIKESRHQTSLIPSPSQKSLKATPSTNSPSSTGSRKRKATSVESVLVKHSQPEPCPDRYRGSTSPAPAGFALSRSTSQEEPELPSPKRLRTRESIEIWDEVMALPESDSNSESPTTKDQTHPVPSRGQNRNTSSRKTHNDDESRHRRRAARSTGRQQALKSISTAELHDLLPRRSHRHQRQNEQGDDTELYLSMDGAEAGEDELSFIPHHRATSRKPTSKTAGRANNSAKAPKKAAQAEANKEQHKDPASALWTQSAQKVYPEASGDASLCAPKRTYSRRVTSDDVVNDSLVTVDDEDSEHVNSDHLQQTIEGQRNRSKPAGTAHEELRNVSKKFEEVDQWEMEFEDVSGSSGSPRNAR